MGCAVGEVTGRLSCLTVHGVIATARTLGAGEEGPGCRPAAGRWRTAPLRPSTQQCPLPWAGRSSHPGGLGVAGGPFLADGPLRPPWLLMSGWGARCPAVLFCAHCRRPPWLAQAWCAGQAVGADHPVTTFPGAGPQPSCSHAPGWAPQLCRPAPTCLCGVGVHSQPGPTPQGRGAQGGAAVGHGRCADGAARAVLPGPARLGSWKGPRRWSWSPRPRPRPRTWLGSWEGPRRWRWSPPQHLGGSESWGMAGGGDRRSGILNSGPGAWGRVPL